MVEVRFRILRAVIDAVFCILLFFGFMCGIHYGTQIMGLYFWHVKFLLGIVGAGFTVRLTGWVKSTLLFIIKNGSIYAECREDCNTVMGAFSGVMSNFKDTVSITVFNRLIREGLKDIKDMVLESKGKEEKGALDSIFENIGNSRIVKVSERIIVKAFDYVDECILGYCFAHEEDNQSIIKNALEAFLIFIKHSPEIFGKVITIISIEIVFRVIYWAVLVMYCTSTFYFGFEDLGATALNLVLCYCVGKLISFILEDAVFEPSLMHGIISTFIKYDYDGDDSAVDELIAKIPALGTLNNYSKNSSGGINDDKSREEYPGDGQDFTRDGMDTGRD